MASFRQETYCPTCKRNVTAGKDDVCPICSGKVKRTTWSARFRTFINGELKDKKLTGFRTLREAKDGVVAAEQEYRRQEIERTARVAAPDDVTIEQLFEEWLRHKSTTLKESSIYEFRNLGINHILVPLGTRKITEITKRDILEWQNWLSEGNYSYAYKNKIRTILSSMFKFAVMYYDLPNNPVAAVPGFKNTEPQKDMEIWTPEQFWRFYDTLPGDTWQCFFATAFLTGCRRGELLALDWNDVDLDSGRIKIYKTITRKTLDENPYKILTPKTASSKRTVTIPTQLCKMLKEYRAAHHFKDADFVFAGERPLSDQSIDRTLRRYTAEADLPTMHMHGFRHSHASLLLATPGITIVDVSRRLGHASITETLNTYAHVLPNGNEHILGVLGGIFNHK